MHTALRRESGQADGSPWPPREASGRKPVALESERQGLVREPGQQKGIGMRGATYLIGLNGKENERRSVQVSWTRGVWAGKGLHEGL